MSHEWPGYTGGDYHQDPPELYGYPPQYGMHPSQELIDRMYSNSPRTDDVRRHTGRYAATGVVLAVAMGAAGYVYLPALLPNILAHSTDQAGDVPPQGTSTIPSTPSKTTVSARSTNVPSSRPTESSPVVATTTPGAKKGVIVIDPGHSGKDIRSIDKLTGLLDHDYPNTPEITEVYKVAMLVRAGLEKDGFTVILTKKSASDSVSLRDRAQVAQNNMADLAVSIHTDHTAPATFQTTYAPVSGQYRGTDPSKPGTKYNDGQTACMSQQYQKKINAARSAALGGKPVTSGKLYFTGRTGLAPGNIALVELFSQTGSTGPGVPWVYNEYGAKKGDKTNVPLTESEISGYATGLLRGIEAAMAEKAAVTTQCLAFAKG